MTILVDDSPVGQEQVALLPQQVTVFTSSVTSLKTYQPAVLVGLLSVVYVEEKLPRSLP